MGRFGQVGIAIGALGVVLALMGMFPQLTGVAPTENFGITQVIMVLFGQSLLIFGAMIYLKTTFYLGIPSTLAQSIGIRLALTGILFASLGGLADILGFGSHTRTALGDFYLGELQAVGLVFSFFISSMGIGMYAVAGNPHLYDEEVVLPSLAPKVDIEKVLNEVGTEAKSVAED